MAYSIDQSIDAGLDQAEGAGPLGPARDWDYRFGPIAVDVHSPSALLYADSTEFVHAQVAAWDTSTDLPQSPAGLSVALAFTLGPDPQAGDWQAAQWLDRSAVDGTYWARLLVGPSAGVALAPGGWFVWVQLSDSPETAVGRAGTLSVR